jgi:hypothetical protein
VNNVVRCWKCPGGSQACRWPVRQGVNIASTMSAEGAGSPVDNRLARPPTGRPCQSSSCIVTSERPNPPYIMLFTAKLNRRSPSPVHSVEIFSTGIPIYASSGYLDISDYLSSGRFCEGRHWWIRLHVFGHWRLYLIRECHRPVFRQSRSGNFMTGFLSFNITIFLTIQNRFEIFHIYFHWIWDRDEV